jgi:hypothetical protein
MKCDKLLCHGCPDQSSCENYAIATRLEEFTGGMMRVHFASDLESGEDSAGHLYRSYFSTECDDNELLYLDDRKSESLELQLVAELRRLADYCRELADELETRCTDAVATA